MNVMDIRAGERYAVLVDNEVVPAFVGRVGPHDVAVRLPPEVAVDPWSRDLVLDPDAILRPWAEYLQLLDVLRRDELRWLHAKARQELDCEQRMVGVAAWLAQAGFERIAVELLSRLDDGTLVGEGVHISAGALEQLVGALRNPFAAAS